MHALPRFGIPVLSVAFVLLVSCVVDTRHTADPALLFLCSIALSAWFGGAGPGLLAGVLAALTFNYCFLAPDRQFSFNIDDAPTFIIFLLSALFIVWLGSAQHAAGRRLKRAHDKLADALARLEQTNATLRREAAERHQVHEELKRSEAFLAEGEKISHAGSWRWNPSTQELLWSDEHFRIYGYEPAAQTPALDSIESRIHPDDRDALRRVVRNAFRDCERFQCEYRVLLPDGTVRHVLGVGYPIPDLYGPKEFVGTTADITVHRQAEAQLRKSEQEFRTLTENSPDGVIRYDLDCRRIYVNPAYERHSGIPAEKAVHEPLEANWHADIPVQEYKETVRRVLSTGVPQHVFGVWRALDGSDVHFAVHMVAERDASNRIIGALAISRNISSLKQTELRLEESRLQLRRLAGRMEAVREEERKHLARELHDGLAQHLFALRMRIRLLDHEFGARNPALSGKARDMTDIVDSTIGTARSVVAALRPVELDMGILPALERLVGEFTAQNQIACALHRNSEDISLPEDITTALFRITQEALRNAAKHARASRVDVGLYCLDDGYLLEVRDNGVGFDPAARKPLSFGLIGIDERVLLMNGTVTITTAPGAGTAIQVRFTGTGKEPAETAAGERSINPD